MSASVALLRRWSVAVTLAGLVIPPITAARAATIMGTGITISCGGWVEIRKTPSKAGVEEWTLGYLSGVAMWTPASPLDGLDAAAVMVWLDNFCQQNPLVPYKLALDEFVRIRAAAMRPPAPPAGAQPTRPAPGAQPPANR